jgi:hypothetical protein
MTDPRRESSVVVPRLPLSDGPIRTARLPVASLGRTTVHSLLPRVLCSGAGVFHVLLLDTILVHDVTSRERSELALRPQRVEIARFDRPRRVIRRINTELVSYFQWPREHVAEVVAESMDVPSATLQGHLRRPKTGYSRCCSAGDVNPG